MHLPSVHGLVIFQIHAHIQNLKRSPSDLMHIIMPEFETLHQQSLLTSGGIRKSEDDVVDAIADVARLLYFAQC